MSTAADVIWFMNLMGTDVHCFLSSANIGKSVFFAHQMINITVCFFCAAVNLANKSTTAFRYIRGSCKIERFSL